MAVSKAVRGHLPFEGLNPSPPLTLTKRVSREEARFHAAVHGFRTAALSPRKSIVDPESALVRVLTGEYLANELTVVVV